MKNFIIATIIALLITLSTVSFAQTNACATSTNNPKTGAGFYDGQGNYCLPLTDPATGQLNGKFKITPTTVAATGPTGTTGSSGPVAGASGPTGTTGGQGFFARQWGKVTGFFSSSTPAVPAPSFQFKGLSYYWNAVIYGQQVAEKEAIKLAKKGKPSGGGLMSWISSPLAVGTGALAMVIFLVVLGLGQWLCPKKLEIFIIPPILLLASIILGLATGYWGRIIGGGLFAVLASLSLCEIKGKPLVMSNKTGVGGDVARYLLAIVLAIVMCLVSC